MHLKKVEAIAEKLLDSVGIDTTPVPVEDIVRKLDLRLKESDLGQDISGVLVIKNGIGTIGINENDGSLRKRFTIAHEIGHYILHRTSGDLFIDKTKVHYRDSNSSKGEDYKEMEANSFAAAILMPQKLVVAEILKGNIDLTDENDIKDLASRFGVSSIAMTYRIANLDLI